MYSPDAEHAGGDRDESDERRADRVHAEGHDGSDDGGRRGDRARPDSEERVHDPSAPVSYDVTGHLEGIVRSGRLGRKT